MLVMGTLNDGSEVEVNIDSIQAWRVYDKYKWDCVYGYFTNNKEFTALTHDERHKFVDEVQWYKSKHEQDYFCELEQEAIQHTLKQPEFTKLKDVWEKGWV